MIVLLFSNNLQINLIDTDQSKFYKIQQNYIDIACRYIHDQFGMTVGKRMFKKLVPLLIGKFLSILLCGFVFFAYKN